MACLEILKQMANFLLDKISFRPQIGIICGSGLGDIIDLVQEKLVVPYSDIDGFPKSTAIGHAGNFVFGRFGNKEIVLMQGRFHPYEGYSTEICTIPIRVMCLMGLEILLITNAAGGLNPSYKVGDLMIIKDHINLPGLSRFSPLVGLNDERLGQRFVSLSDAYDKELIKIVKNIALQMGEEKRIHEGVYAMQIGPAFETVSECRMMKMMGGDACGMSTTHEVLVARQMGIRVFAMSLITDESILEYDTDLMTCALTILEISRHMAKIVGQIFNELVSQIDLTNRSS